MKKTKKAKKAEIIIDKIIEALAYTFTGRWRHQARGEGD